jgi:hypothetical protein
VLPPLQPALSLRHLIVVGSNPRTTPLLPLTTHLPDLRFQVGTAHTNDGARALPAEEFKAMFPVIFLDNMTIAAQAILALFAVLAAGLNFMFSARA